MKLKKLFIALSAAALVLGALCVVTGCGPDNETVIRNAITEELDAYKNADESAMSQIVEMVENEGLDQMGIDGEEFAAAVLDGFDYTIDGIKVNGSTATVDLTIISKSYSSFEEKITDAANAITEDPASAELSTDDLMNLMGERIIEAFDDVEVITENVSVDYELKGNIWEPVNGENSLAELDSIVFAQ